MSLKYWLKQRHNPQLGIYYVKCGQLTQKAAKQMEKSVYGDNYMLSFPNLELYQAEIDKLIKSGEKVL
jgi:hypothetical protein